MTTTTALVTILELPQGRYSNLAGMTLVDALVMFHEDGAKFLRENPSCAKYYEPRWQVRHVPPDTACPWGHEQYNVAEDGMLSVRAFNHDSSD